MVTKSIHGITKEGREAALFTVTNKNGMTVVLSEYGARIVSLTAPDKNGVYADVVLGCDTLAEYENDKGAYFGATVGRCANRIRGGKFMLGGFPVILNCNDGKNHLHGGNVGFDRRVWHGESTDEQSVIFSLMSADGDEGYPGNMNVDAKYTLSDNNSLTIEYSARSDKDTVVNLTNKSYFNLAGHDKNGADRQILRINADCFTGIDTELLPDGTIMPSECTPLDFRNYARINSRIDFDYIQLRNAGGYDHNFVLKKRERGLLSLAAELYDTESERYMTVHTTLPGMQFYSGNFLDCIQGKGGALYMKRGGICLETQFFPNSMEHTHFPSPILRAGEEYRAVTRYTFSVKKLDPKCYS